MAAMRTTQATFAATLVDEWVRCGVTDAVVAPGSRSTPLVLALAADDRIRTHVHHDERSAAFMALGIGSATGRPALVVTTSGTAAVELHPAVVEAHQGRVPLIACTADRPPELQSVGAPQTVDQTHLFGRAVRWFAEPGVADEAMRPAWRSLAARAVAEATGPPPGPVHLNLAFREPLVGEPDGLPPGRDGERPWHELRRGPRRTAALDELPPRGVIVAGRGAANARSLGDATGYPVLVDARGGEGDVAAFDAILRHAPFAEAHRPEVVIRLGEPPASKVLAQWLAASGAEQLAVTTDAGWFDADRTAAVVIDADALVVERPRPDSAWLAAWRQAEAAAQAAIDEVLDRHPEATEPGIARALTTAAPAGSVLVVSSSMPVRDVEWYGRRRADVTVLANRGANGIDGVVSTAAGAALGTGHRTIALLGDVAFLHDGNGLLGLASRPIDLTLVVVDNDGGGIFSFLPQATAMAAAAFERFFGTPHGVDVGALAAVHGLPVLRIKLTSDLPAALDGTGARVVVATTEREANVAVHDEIHAAVATGLGGPGATA
jgi:2-succinyl-5-enolpyruvyl-6-hydroxy-3-cyclohexene-1-carboxylate synthase